MIAFGCSITDARAYERHAEPGIRRAAEADSEVLIFRDAGSIFRAYNLLCEQAGRLEGLEALVLVHQDAELVDPDLCQKLRQAFRDPEVALAGCGGAVGVRSVAWWEGSTTWASYTHRFEEMGGGDLPGLSWHDDHPAYARTGEVDSLDGVLIAMSPWAVLELRFDESIGRLHGYDLDICLQARAAGKKVVTIDTRLIHYHSLDLMKDPEGWIAAHMRVAEKWSDLLEDGRTQDWRRRARRAEAEAEATRLQLRAAQHHITRLAEDFDALRRSRSWRLTAPVRALGRLFRRLRHPRQPAGRQLGEGVVSPGPELAARASEGTEAESAPEG
jgi:GT2 family glycosyltransferase